MIKNYLKYLDRYILAYEVESNIPNLDSALVKQAQRVGADLFAVSALEIIRDPKKAKHFKEVVYPLEIAKQLFPDEDYIILEMFALDKTVETENCGGFLFEVTPKIIANRRIHSAYHHVYSVVYGEDPKLKKIWDII